VNPNPTPPSATALGPREILLILFRNKWKIIFCSLLGFAAAVVLYFKLPPSYESTAKIFVRFIVEQPAGVPGDAGLEVRPADSRGDGLMTTEAEILGSMDLAQAVVNAVGPAEILGHEGITNALFEAVIQLRDHFKIQTSNRGSVITLSYVNSRPAAAQRVLQEIVRIYREKHVEAHSSAGSYDSLLRETDAMSARIKENQAKLTSLKDNLGVTSLAETKSQIASQIASLEAEIIRVKAELAQSEARLAELQRRSGAGGATNSAVSEIASPVDGLVAQEYRTLVERLERYRSRELDLLGLYTEEHPEVKQLQSDRATAERRKLALESENPGLLATPRGGEESGTGAPASAEFVSNFAAISAARAELLTFENELSEYRRRRSAITEGEDEMMELERSLKLDEESYQKSLIALRGARFNEALDPSKIPNINVLQNPSVPVKAVERKKKFCLAAAAAGLALGLGLTGLREFLLDHSIRTPLEVETQLRLPMFLSIPLMADRQPVRLLTEGGDSVGTQGGKQRDRSPWQVSNAIRPYCDALRDRLIMYFQLKNIHHKPKLVAVTSCSEGAGTTTVAAALAASLSETGDGKVLLVDMNVSRPEMHPFFRGNLASSLPDLFQPGASLSAGQYDNLFLATGTERNGEVTPLVPARFYELLPRMRASDFDYIIFDMPVVKQTSATVTLSGFMDKVLLLIEPGKTNREAVKRATELMRQQHADVAGVVNRLPESTLKWLQPELA